MRDVSVTVDVVWIWRGHLLVRVLVLLLLHAVVAVHIVVRGEGHAVAALRVTVAAILCVSPVAVAAQSLLRVNTVAVHAVLRVNTVAIHAVLCRHTVGAVLLMNSVSVQHALRWVDAVAVAVDARFLATKMILTTSVDSSIHSTVIVRITATSLSHCDGVIDG